MLKRKIKTLPQLKTIVKKLKKLGKKIIFSNGCFDILHYGHIKYLEQAKKKGDILIIGLNSDQSVKLIKGKKRPINGQAQRADVLSALLCVDFITIFRQKTPYDLISQIKPDILVKGGDWAKEEIVGSDILAKNKGKVITIPYVRGFSTTTLIKKIKRAECRHLG